MEKFEKLLKKSTIDSLSEFRKAKVACVCRNPARRAGVLVRNRIGFPPSGYVVDCAYPTFAANGSFSLLTSCTDWELLTK